MNSCFLSKCRKLLSEGDDYIVFSANLLVYIGLFCFVFSGFSHAVIYLLILLPAICFLCFFRTTRPSSLFYMWAFYLSYVVVSCMWSHTAFLDVLDRVKYIFYIGVFLYALDRFSRNGSDITLCVLLFIASLFVEFYSIANYIYSHGFYYWLEKLPRIYGIVGIKNPIYISSIIVISLVAIVSSLNNEKTKHYYVLAAFVLGVVVLLPLQTRASILGLCVGLIVILFQMKKYKILFVFFSIGILVSVFLFLEIDRFLNNSYPRLDIWLYVYSKVVSSGNFVFGNGFLYDFDVDIHGRNYSQLHSLVLSQFFYGGIFGFSAFAVVVILTLLKMYAVKSSWLPVLCSGLAMLFTMRHEIVNGPDIVWVLLWLPVGISGVLFSRVDSDK